MSHPVPGADLDRCVLRAQLAELEALLRRYAQHGAHCALPRHSGWRPGDAGRCQCWLGRSLLLIRFSQ